MLSYACAVAPPPPPNPFLPGTAGLRAKMGPGFNRMNPVTVQQTTQGLLRYLQQQAPQQLADNGVIIGEQLLLLGCEQLAWYCFSTCRAVQGLRGHTFVPSAIQYSALGHMRHNTLQQKPAQCPALQHLVRCTPAALHLRCARWLLFCLWPRSFNRTAAPTVYQRSSCKPLCNYVLGVMIDGWRGVTRGKHSKVWGVAVLQGTMRATTARRTHTWQQQCSHQQESRCVQT